MPAKLPSTQDLIYARSWLQAGAPAAHPEYDAKIACQILIEITSALPAHFAKYRYQTKEWQEEMKQPPRAKPLSAWRRRVRLVSSQQETTQHDGIRLEQAATVLETPLSDTLLFDRDWVVEALAGIQSTDNPDPIFWKVQQALEERLAKIDRRLAKEKEHV